MNDSKIPVRYAKALFFLAKETKTFDTIKKDMQLLYQGIHEIPELQFIIKSPVIKVSDKINLFHEAFKDSFSQVTLSFIKLVLENRREEYLTRISLYFLYKLKKELGISPASLLTASPIDEKLRQSVINLISRKFNTKAELTEEVDQKIIGGFILRINDQQIDASIASKLSRIKKELINSHS
jgi:F-type H+-transporting ATPase subunit delta